MKEIILTKGYAAVIDDDDFERVSCFKWYACECKSGVYAMRMTYPERKPTVVHLSRFILNAPNNKFVDHINNTLDNRKENLRLATNQQNSFNRRKLKRKTFKGTYHRVNRKQRPFSARIKFNNKTHYLGTFATEIEAAKAYDAKAKELFGEFAYLNFPKQKDNFFVKASGNAKVLVNENGHQATTPSCPLSKGARLTETDVTR
jgi:hypothetical protein